MFRLFEINSFIFTRAISIECSLFLAYLTFSCMLNSPSRFAGNFRQYIYNYLKLFKWRSFEYCLLNNVDVT